MSEQLSISLHLAKVMGLKPTSINYSRNLGGVSYVSTVGRSYSHRFDPFERPRQWQQVVLWAAMNGLEPDLSRGIVRVWPVGKDYPCCEENDNTPQGIIDATLKAIALATGWEAFITPGYHIAKYRFL